MRLATLKRSGCGLMGAMTIAAIIYYALGGIWFMRNSREQPSEYYSPTAGLIVSQCSGGRCSSGSYSAPYSEPVDPQFIQTSSQTSGNFGWDSYGPPWRLYQGGATLGTLYADGTFRNHAGESVPCPATWYPMAFDKTKLNIEKVGSTPVDKTGDTDPKLFGIASKEMESSLSKTTNHYKITDSSGHERFITRSDAFNAVGDSRLKSLLNGYNLAIIGVDAVARQKMVVAAKASLPINSPVVVSEYDPNNPADLWHVEGDWNHALSHRPSLAQSGAVAYFTNGPQESNKQSEVMAWTPEEVTKVTSSIRPRDGIPNHDPAKAKVDQPLFGISSWPLTNYQTMAGLIILAGCILLFTTKPPTVEA